MEERVEYHLHLWAAWHRASRYGRGYPSRSSGFVWGGYSQDFDSMVAESDKHCAVVTDVVIWGLVPAERCSIYVVHLDAVYQLKEPVELVYDRAKGHVWDGLRSRGIF
jgi:hypothetical protein